MRRKNEANPDPTLYGTGWDGPIQGAHVDRIYCHPPGQLIVGNPSLLAIEEVRRGSRIAGREGIEEVTRGESRFYSGEIIKLWAQSTPVPIVATPEHPILVARREHCKRPSWVMWCQGKCKR